MPTRIIGRFNAPKISDAPAHLLPIVRSRLASFRPEGFDKKQKKAFESGRHLPPLHRVHQENRVLSRFQKSYEQRRYGNVSTIDMGDDEFEAALAKTRELITNPKTHVILCPALFCADSAGLKSGLGVRPAALVRKKDKSWRLVELAGTASIYDSKKKGELKEGLVADLALMVFVGRQMGLPITSAGISHLNADWVFTNDHNDNPSDLFKFHLLDGAVEKRQEAARQKYLELQDRFEKEPSQDIYFENDSHPEDDDEAPVTNKIDYTPQALYKLHHKQKDKLKEAGITDIRNLPADFETRFPDIRLDALHKRQIRSLQTGEFVLEDVEALRAKVQNILDAHLKRNERISFFDFETINQLVAPLVGSKNNQILTTQFSNHFIGSDGHLYHDEFLYDRNPLEDNALLKLDTDLASSILSTVGKAGPILVFNQSFEKSRLRELSARLKENGKAELASQIDYLMEDGLLYEQVQKIKRSGYATLADNLAQAIGSDENLKKFEKSISSFKGISETEMAMRKRILRAIELARSQSRIVDMLPLFQDHIYHPDFHSSFSIKVLLKVLFPGKSYDDLEIKNGDMATNALEVLIDPETPASQKEIIRQNLLTYCFRDTITEVWLLQKLCELTGLIWPFTN